MEYKVSPFLTTYILASVRLIAGRAAEGFVLFGMVEMLVVDKLGKLGRLGKVGLMIALFVIPPELLAGLLTALVTELPTELLPELLPELFIAPAPVLETLCLGKFDPVELVPEATPEATAALG